MAINRNLVFIVENDHFQEDLLHQFFDKDHKHEFVYFEHSKDCLEALHRHPIAVIVDYDLKMIDQTEMDAIKFLDKIKLLEHDTEVVLFSHVESLKLATDALKHGAYDYIVVSDYKYLRLQQVLRNIEKHFNNVQDLKKEKVFKRLLAVVTGAFVITMLILWKLGFMEPRNGTLIEP